MKKSFTEPEIEILTFQCDADVVSGGSSSGTDGGDLDQILGQ